MQQVPTAISPTIVEIQNSVHFVLDHTDRPPVPIETTSHVVLTVCKQIKRGQITTFLIYQRTTDVPFDVKGSKT